MQLDLYLDLDLDLDLRSNFQIDLSRSKDTPSDASRREEHVGINSFFVSCFFTSYKQKCFWKYFVSLTFDDLWSLNR